MLARPSAVDDADADLFHDRKLSTTRTRTSPSTSCPWSSWCIDPIVNCSFLDDRDVLLVPRHPYRRPRASRRHDHRPWGDRDAGVHAGRNAGRREGDHAPRSREPRRGNHPRQHLSSLSASGRRADRPTGRPAPVHRLAAADPDRQRRVSDLQPVVAADDHRRGRALPIASRWFGASPDAGEGGRHPGASRIGHRDGARRVRGVPLRHAGEPATRCGGRSIGRGAPAIACSSCDRMRSTA